MTTPESTTPAPDAVSTTLDPSSINVILATDCGSTTTKAILIEKVDGEYRQTYRGEAPTTVEEPAADVTMGVVNSVTEVGELAGRKLIGDDGQVIRPASDGQGCDIYISTSSAGGGLQMMVAGVVREMTAASAKRAALGAGAIVMDTIATNDKRLPHEQIQRIRELRPDMILISGGTDGGTTQHVVQIAEMVAPAKPQPRFGAEYRMPVIFAGNVDARDAMKANRAEGQTLGSRLDDLLRVGQVPPLPTVIGLVFPRRELMELREGDVALPLPPVEWEILLDAGGVGEVLRSWAARSTPRMFPTFEGFARCSGGAPDEARAAGSSSINGARGGNDVKLSSMVWMTFRKPRAISSVAPRVIAPRNWLPEVLRAAAASEGNG